MIEKVEIGKEYSPWNDNLCCTVVDIFENVVCFRYSRVEKVIDYMSVYIETFKKYFVPFEKDYKDFKIDDKVIVWDNDMPESKNYRYFSHVDERTVYTFAHGATSWSSQGDMPEEWDNCIKAEE